MFSWWEQKVIVTGAGGFVGRHMVERLHALGAVVVPVYHRDYDLRNTAHARQLFYAHHDATLVIHLAANVGGIGLNRARPAQLFYDNATMGLNVLECARVSGIPKFVGIGTVCSYPADTPVPFREVNLWNGYPEETNAPYGLAKKMLLAQSQAYRDEYGYNAIHLLPTNMYGEGDNFQPDTSHVIPAMIRKMIEAKSSGVGEVVLWGDGTATRDFLYIKDAVEAIALAAERYDGREALNLGSGEEWYIANLAELIAGHVGYEGKLRWDTTQPNGQQRRLLDTSRAQALLGWQARTPLNEGLSRTVSWLRGRLETAP